MATYNLKRFARPDGLNAITPKNLLKLLEPYRLYFDERRYQLPVQSDADDLDYEHIQAILMTPDQNTPKALLEALYLIHESSIPENVDSLVKEAEKEGIVLDDNSESTAADVAVQIYLKNRTFLERAHAEQQVARLQKYTCFQSVVKESLEYRELTEEDLDAFTQNLDVFYEKNGRGRGSCIFVFPKEDEVWFLVRHGERFHRQDSLDAGKTKSLFYRPIKYDAIVFRPHSGEIRMNACGKNEMKLFCRQFGYHLFGDEEFFPGTEKYTLEPLRTAGVDSVVCSDVEGMEWIKLTKIRFNLGGPYGENDVRSATDLFAVREEYIRSMPPEVCIDRASFSIKFTDSKKPRPVSIQTSNIARYSRESDAVIVEDWLLKRGFILERQDEDIREGYPSDLYVGQTDEVTRASWLLARD